MRIAKILGLLVALLGLMVVGGFVLLLTNYPDVGPAPQIDIARTPAQIERG